MIGHMDEHLNLVQVVGIGQLLGDCSQLFFLEVLIRLFHPGREITWRVNGLILSVISVIISKLTNANIDCETVNIPFLNKISK